MIILKMFWKILYLLSILSNIRASYFNQILNNYEIIDMKSCELHKVSDVQDDRCLEWTASITITPGLNRTSLIVYFSPWEANKCSYQLFIFWLYKIVYASITETIEHKCIKIHENKCDDPQKGNYCFKYLEIEFENLQNGHYSIEVWAIHETCSLGMCNQLSGGEKNLTNRTDPHIDKKEDKENDINLKIILPICLLLLAICAIITIKILYKKYKKIIYMKSTLLNEVKAHVNQFEVDALIFFCENSKEIVNRFIDVLKECFNLQNVYSIMSIEIEAEIIRDGNDWVTNALKTTENSEVQRKIIFVESEDAVRYSHMRINDPEEYKNLDFSNIHRYDLLFINALKITEENITRRLSDYDHIYVVHFENTPMKEFLEHIIPKIRYFLPSQLPFLYYRWIHKRMPTSLEYTEKIEEWSNISSYKKFKELFSSDQLN